MSTMIPFERPRAGLVVVLCLLLSLIGPGGGAAQDLEAPSAPPAGTVTVQDLEGLVATLEDPAARAQLVQQLRTLIEAQRTVAAAEPEAATLGASTLRLLSEGMEELSGRVSVMIGIFDELPQAFTWLQGQVADPWTRERWLALMLQLAVAIGAGAVAEWLAAWLLRRPKSALERRAPASLLGRLPLALARLMLTMVPIGAFAVGGYGALFVTEPPSVIRLVALTIINAAILVQVVLALARFLFAPAVPALRLLPRMTDEAAQYAYIWVRRLAYTAIYGYFIAQAALVLGLPYGAHAALLKLFGLVVAAMLVVLVLQNRHAFAEWLRVHPLSGDGDAAQREAAEIEAGRRNAALRMVRRRLADVWHVLTILYIAIIYGIWAFNVPGGFAFMVRATVMSVLVFVLARLMVTLIERAVRRGFAISPELKAQFPNLELRANRYLPVVERIVKLVVWGVALLVLLNAWGLDSFAWLESPTGQRVVSAAVSLALTFTLAILAWEVVNNLIERYLSGSDGRGGQLERSARVRTLLPLLRNALLVVLVTLVGLVTLSELGVNIAPLLAGAGVIGLAIGFGSQTLVKDVITGLFMLIEDTIAVGDVVDVGGGHSGVVEAISIRAIRLRDVSGNVHTVPFSAVSTVLNMTKDFSFYVLDIGVAYREDVDQVIQVVKELGAELQADPEYGREILEPIEVLGVDALRDSAVIIKARIKTKPIKQWLVGREFNRRMKKRFDELGIEIPFPHLTLYFGQDKQGQAPPAHIRLAEPEALALLAGQMRPALVSGSGDGHGRG